MAATNDIKLTLQEELVVSAVLNEPTISEYHISKKTNIPKKEVSLILKRPVVTRALEQRRKEIAGEGMVTVKRVIDEEMCIAFADPIDLINENGEFIPLNKMPERIRRAIAKVEVFERNGSKIIKYQFSDKGKALERIGKHLGMYEADNKQKQGRIFFIRYDEAEGVINITPKTEDEKPEKKEIPKKRGVALLD